VADQVLPVLSGGNAAVAAAGERHRDAMTRNIVVSGSASGIGKAYSDLMRSRGDRVVGIDLRDVEVEADVGTEEGRRRAVTEALAATDGHIDVVVACAGIAKLVPELVSVNYFGATALINGLRPALASSAAPRAALITSITAQHATDAEVIEACLTGDEERALAAAAALIDAKKSHLLYSSSKAAVEHWMRRTAVQPGWADAGIALNAVAPGVVITPMNEALLADARARAMIDASIPMPLNGHAPPAAVAHALSWLTDVSNTHVTGEVLRVDGGSHAMTKPSSRGDRQPSGS
jgi:NAD(P)-dependent dehydrogenase (short-subunit alcohol dehydrogenase family)